MLLNITVQKNVWFHLIPFSLNGIKRAWICSQSITSICGGDFMKDYYYPVAMLLGLSIGGTTILTTSMTGCDNVEDHYKQQKKEAWEEPCHDTSMLLATTAGSPNEFTCPNKHHRMQVQITTTASNEEVGALVFCQCMSEDQ